MCRKANGQNSKHLCMKHQKFRNPCSGPMVSALERVYWISVWDPQKPTPCFIYTLVLLYVKLCVLVIVDPSKLTPRLKLCTPQSTVKKEENNGQDWMIMTQLFLSMGKAWANKPKLNNSHMSRSSYTIKDGWCFERHTPIRWQNTFRII